MKTPSRGFATLLAAASITAAMPAWAARAAKPFETPPAVTYDNTLSDAQASSAIKIGLSHRAWTVTQESPGVIQATLIVRQHHLVENFHYGHGEVTLEYVDSQELEAHTEGTALLIHPKVGEWNRLVLSDIYGELIRASSSK